MDQVDDLKIKITAEGAAAERGIKSVERGTDSLTKKLGKLAVASLGTAGAVVAIKKLASMLKEASEAAAVQESAIIRLGAALDVTGNSGNNALVEMQDFASALQRVTVVGDEVSLGLMQMAVNMGLSAKEAQTATQQAIALSRAYGIDLNTAMVGVVNTMQGQTSTLTRYIPSLKAAGNATERMAILNDEAAKAWAIATAEVNTATGAQAQYQNAINQLRNQARRTRQDDMAQAASPAGSPDTVIMGST